jgi:hypothetical protein
MNLVKLGDMNKVRIHTLTVAALAGLVLGFSGCSSSSAPPAPPVTPEQLTQLQQTYRNQRPDARVGEVTAVLSSSNLASISDVPVKDFTEGDIITFLDSNGKVLTMGKVEAVTENSLTVKYDPPGKGGREPAIGDVAVRLIH